MYGFEMRGGKSWFAMEVKSFEISIVEATSKLRGALLESGRGCSNRIRFGEVSLSCLLEGVEGCCKEKGSKVCNKVWKLRRVQNGVGRFILSSICNMEAKRLTLIF